MALNRTKNIPFAALILLLIGSLSYGADAVSKRLEVEISGNTRTKDSTILRLAHLEDDRVPKEGINPGYIKQELLNSHLFSTVELNVVETEEVTKVKITVVDKWTILPVPIFYTSAQKTGGGFMVVESNLFGRKKLLMLSAAFSTVGNRYEGIYLDDSLFGSNWILVARPRYTKRTLYQYVDEKKIYAYNDDNTQFFTVLGYKITDHIAPAIGFNYMTRYLKQEDHYLLPPREGRAHGVLMNLTIKDIDYVNYYDQGIEALIVYEQSLKELGAETVYGHVMVKAEFVKPLWEFLTRSQLSGGWSLGPDVNIANYYRLGGQPGTRGLPDSGLWVSNYVSISEQVEQVVYHFKFGTVTVAEFYDGVFTNEDDPFKAYNSLGLGMRIYLKKVAVPGVGFDAAYSLNTSKWHVTAFIGKVF